ncbi:MAG: esterase/lipase family protein [Symbiobacteriia bacterium]
MVRRLFAFLLSLALVFSFGATAFADIPQGRVPQEQSAPSAVNPAPVMLQAQPADAAAKSAPSTTPGDSPVPQYPAVPSNAPPDGGQPEAGAVTPQALTTAAATPPPYYGNSGVSPYTLYDNYATDEVFIADRGGDLDQYLFVDRTPLTFNVPVTRYYGEVDGEGYLKYPYLMNSKGIIPLEATLFIRVYDVDNDYQGSGVNPEVDVLKINGHELSPTLTSGNNTWSTLTYKVPVTYIKFPSPGALGQRPTPAQNQITIDIDTANGGQIVWAVEVDWAAIQLSGVRPAALVNGILSGADAWKNFRNDLGLDMLPSEPVEVGGWSSIATNTQTLLKKLPDVKAKFGVDRLNIIAHSKGGLDTRSYLRLRDDIDMLVQLGTPNRGSECATIIAGYAAPMTRNLRPDWIFEHFNYQKVAGQWQLNTPEMGVAPIRIYAGTSETSRFCMAYLGAINVRMDTPNDGVVSVDRATLPWKWSGVDGDNVDQGNVDARAAVNHGGLHEQQYIADQVVSWLASERSVAMDGATAQAFAAPAEAQAPEILSADAAAVTVAGQPEPPDWALIDGFTGELADGETRTLTVPVSATGRARFRLAYTDGDPSLEVVSPDGQVLTPTTAQAAGATYTAVQGMLLFKLYDVPTPMAGTWTLRVTGTGATHLFELAAGQLAAPFFEAGVSESQIQPGATTIVTGKLTDAAGSPLTGAAMNAEVTAPDGSAQTVALSDDGTSADAVAGDGTYSGLAGGQTDGYYTVRETALLADGTRRLAMKDFAVGGASAQLLGNLSAAPVDLNGNGLFDQLQVGVDMQVNEPGSYLISADLVDGQGALIDTATTMTESDVAAGTTRLTLGFNGSRIYQHQVNGPFSLKNLRLERAGGITLATVDPSYLTAAYSYQSFEHARLRLGGTGSDQGVDTNGDGLYDALQVVVGVDSDVPGWHWVTARLMTGDEREVDWVEGWAYLQQGRNNIGMAFDGRKVRRSGYNGSFVLTDFTLQGPAGSLVATDVYRTGSYSYTSFARIPTDLYLLPGDIQVKPDPAPAGGKATVTATVRNAGLTAGPFLVEFFEGDPNRGGTLIGTQTAAGVDTESTVDVSVPWAVPTKEGAYSLYVRVNENRALYEWDYSNDEAWRSVEVAQAAIPAQVRLDPQTLNLGSEGRMVTVFVQLPQGYDPATVDVSTLQLGGKGTAAAAALLSPSAVTGGDGQEIPELMVKFDRGEVEALADALLPAGEQRGTVTLTLTGALTDGTQINGILTIEVIRK